MSTNRLVPVSNLSNVIRFPVSRRGSAAEAPPVFAPSRKRGSVRVRSRLDVVRFVRASATVILACSGMNTVFGALVMLHVLRFDQLICGSVAVTGIGLLCGAAWVCPLRVPVRPTQARRGAANPVKEMGA